MGGNYDIETIKAELPYIVGTAWYKRLVEELDEYKRDRMSRMLDCKDIQRLGSLQGAVRAVDDIKAKLTKED